MIGLQHFLHIWLNSSVWQTLIQFNTFVKKRFILASLTNKFTLAILEKIDFEEFQLRDTQAMAKFIAKVKEAQPETKSRHSRQAWIQNYSGNSDSVIASLQERWGAVQDVDIGKVKVKG